MGPIATRDPPFFLFFLLFFLPVFHILYYVSSRILDVTVWNIRNVHHHHPFDFSNTFFLLLLRPYSFEHRHQWGGGLQYVRCSAVSHKHKGRATRVDEHMALACI
jgi:hypothetical protein